MSRTTQVPSAISRPLSPTGLSPSSAGFSKAVRLAPVDGPATVLQPPHCRNSPGLGSCAFARHYLRNHYCFLFLRLLRCFSSPGLPPAWQDTILNMVGCPIRKSVLKRVFAPGHSLSQLVTSFVASESQGILHVPFSPFLFSLEFFVTLCTPLHQLCKVCLRRH